METAIWIIIAVAGVAIGYAAARLVARRNAKSAANIILEDARREADVIKEKKILQAKEEEMRILSEAERSASQKIQKAQASEARARQKEQQLSQQQGELARRKKELDNLKTNLDARETTVNSRSEQVEQAPFCNHTRKSWKLQPRR